jgi:hypothetical protein
VSHRRDNADDEKVLQLKNAIGVSGDNGSENLKNDDYEQNVVDRLDHAGRKERVCFKDSNNREVKSSSRDGKKEYPENDVKDLFDSLDPEAGHNQLVLLIRLL